LSTTVRHASSGSTVKRSGDGSARNIQLGS
jgi:hypothetical protein